MIKPQVPPKVKQPKFQDTEGLGKRIPIENIAGIATTIASGGLAGVLGAGEAIGGAAIGGAVGTGVNSALGGGNIGYVVSGIAGGLAGRATATRTTRTTRTRGNRLGGRQTNTRNIDGQNMPVHHDQSEPLIRGGGRLGGRTEGPMTRINRTINRTMRQASETVSNLQNQISETGENVMSRIRRPRNIPRSDESLIPLREGELRWENEMAQNEQNRKAANTITAAFRRKKEENT